MGDETAEVSRWRAAFDRIALDPAEYRHALSHVADCEDNCELCRDLARQALDEGVDAQERAADILAERDRLRAAIVTVHGELVGALEADSSSDIVESVRRLRAERDRLRAVVDGLRGYLSVADVEDDESAVHDALREMLGELDVSPDTGGKK